MTKNKKILVTGGAGFIGSHTVVELFNAGYQPIIIDNFSNSEHFIIERISKIIKTDVKLYQGDCNDEAFMKDVFQKETDISGVIHFAAFKAVKESVDFPLKYYHNNINSLIVLLNVMKEFNCLNLVFSSSSCVYGQPDKLPVVENSPTKKAECPYGTTKKICEEILTDYVNSNAAIKIVALRYFNPIGAHSTSLIGELPIGIPGNLVPFITQTAAGIRKELTIFGDDYDTPDGTCIRDYIHVVDLACAHVESLSYLNNQQTNNFYDVFNVGTGKGNSVIEVVTTFNRVNNLQLNYVMGKRRPGDIIKSFASVDKINKTLGWKAKLSLDDALRDAWNWQKTL